jgi:hypothetical protein
MYQLDERVEYYFDKIKKGPFWRLQHLYSPMFDKTFDKLSDEEIKKQIELWVIDELSELM